MAPHCPQTLSLVFETYRTQPYSPPCSLPSLCPSCLRLLPTEPASLLKLPFALVIFPECHPLQHFLTFKHLNSDAELWPGHQEAWAYILTLILTLLALVPLLFELLSKAGLALIS